MRIKVCSTRTKSYRFDQSGTKVIGVDLESIPEINTLAIWMKNIPPHTWMFEPTQKGAVERNYIQSFSLLIMKQNFPT